MREAGLPIVTSDVHGESQLFFGSKGVVRAVYPDLWRVDLEAEDGSLFRGVPVVGPYFPEIHTDKEAPSHVGYMHIRGSAQVFCWPLTHRRLLGPDDQPEGGSGEPLPERRYYHTHSYIFRSGDITVRITKDHKIILETEQGDFLLLDQQRREIRLHAPTVLAGTDDAQGNRLEYQQDESFRAFNPLVILGTETEDRIEYLKGVGITLQAPIIKLTAEQAITLDPPRINFGTETASEQIILGNLFQSFLNAFLVLFNSHVHTNVQTGGGVSGPPQTPTSLMPNSTLSTVARVSE